MKVRQNIAIVASLLLLAGCSSTPVQTARSQLDQDYINQVEAAAKKNSLSPRIYWVNPPMKKEAGQQ